MHVPLYEVDIRVLKDTNLKMGGLGQKFFLQVDATYGVWFVCLGVARLVLSHLFRF